MPTQRSCDGCSQINDQESMNHVSKVNNPNDPSRVILCNEQIIRHEVIVNDLRP